MLIKIDIFSIRIVRKIHMVLKRSLPSLNALKMFEAVARNNSLTYAAEELCVTHSAVSHQIKQLETWMGKKLFYRHAHGVSLTDDGKILFTTCLQAFNSIENCIIQLQKIPKFESITLGAPTSFIANWLIQRLEKFEKNFPNIKIKLMTCNNIKALEAEQIDLLILNQNTPFIFSNDIYSLSLFPDLIGPVCTPVQECHIKQPIDILSHVLLHSESNKEAWSIWAEKYHIDINKVKHHRYFEHLNLILEATASNLGIAIAPKILVEKDILSGRLVAPLGFVDCGSTFYICQKKIYREHTNIQFLINWLIEEMR